MVIQWYGQSCFKIQSGEVVVAIDPFDKEIGLTPPRFRADVVLVTHAHADHAHVESLGGEPFVISGPGEYEIHTMYIHGIDTFHDQLRGKERGKNTIFKIEMEDIRILHMGDFGEEEMRDETLEAVGEVDVLMIPVGGTYTIDAEAAARIINQIEPRFAIPMHYKIPGIKPNLADLSGFLKEMGVPSQAAEEKLSLKKKDFATSETTAIRVLKAA